VERNWRRNKLDININLSGEAEYAIKESIAKLSNDNWLWKVTVIHEKIPSEVKATKGSFIERTTIKLEKKAREE
jgi:hypothetical protein